MKVLGPGTDPLDALQRGAGVLRVQPPTYYDILSGNAYTFTLADTGTAFIWNGAADVVLTVPDSLPDGWTCKVSQFSTGKVTFNAGTRTYFSNSTAAGLIQPGTSIFLGTATVLTGGTTPVRILYALSDQPLPILTTANTSAQTRNATTMVAIPGLSSSMDANSIYDVDLIIPFTSAITTNTLRVGFSALPSGATCNLEARVWNTNSTGTAPTSNGLMTTSALAVAGIAGTAAVVGQTMLARVTGRITTAGTGGALAATCGAIATTGNVSIASGAASMTLQKVK